MVRNFSFWFTLNTLISVFFFFLALAAAFNNNKNAGTLPAQHQTADKVRA